MAKIILSIGGAVLREMELATERITIGRAPDNDIVIDDLAVSARHAVIGASDNDVCVEDLNSTNGTQVNGQPVRKHFLQHNDLIGLASYTIRYLPDATRDETPTPATPEQIAKITVLNGPKAGREDVIVKPLTTIGKANIQVAAITKRPDGFFINHIEGAAFSRINGRDIGPHQRLLLDGDVIDMAGTEVRFSLG